MTKDEALKLALQYVEDSEGGTADLEAHIKEALSQRTWVNLTSEEIGEIYRVGWANNMELARAIEAKLKEKNDSTV